MDVDVWHGKLWEAIPIVVLQLRDDEIEAIRHLCCVDLDDRGTGFDGGRVRAPAEDAARWRAAAQAVVAAMRSVQERDRQARGRLAPPYRFWEGLRWQVRWGFRLGRLRLEYDEHRAALEDEVRSAYRAYRDAAADLTDYVAAWRERRALEQRERETRQRADRLAMVREAVGDAVWAYRIGDHANHRQLLIWLPAIEHGDAEEHSDARRGLTARQVQRVIQQERARDPYTWIEWQEATATAMQEWHADRAGDGPAGGDRAGEEVKAWAVMTGVRVEPTVWRPGELEELRAWRANHGYGPSSNYWSPSGF